jgi:signal transduction histidine kinase
VQRSQRYLLSLINDMLNLVRIEMGRIEYVLEDIPLAALVRDVTSMVEPLFSAKYLTCEVVAAAAADDGAIMSVRADREKVQQILLNLLSNAIKISEVGGKITVGVSASAENPAIACVSVRDTGSGIPASKFDAIFEPFVQLATRPVAERQGVGLGLAISRDLARRMGGDIAVASALGEGSTFTLSLPRA